MLNRRLPWHGLVAVLLALIAQLGAGASVPRAETAAVFAGIGVICHAGGDNSSTPDHPPMRPADCLICPACIALHAPSAIMVPQQAAVSRSDVVVVVRGELPPPSTAPPSPLRPVSQPRAPPTVS